MRLIYGTGNPAKLALMRQNLEGLPVEIVGLPEVLQTPPGVAETGADPLENATIKAKAYARALQERAPVFSCDSGLYIEGVPDALQPGVHVRRVNGRSLTDDEMIAYYSALLARYGGRCIAQYRSAVCLVSRGGQIIRSAAEDLSGERFILSSRAHPRRRQGHPLDSLSIEIASGRYYFDLQKTRASSTAGGYRRFFKEALGL